MTPQLEIATEGPLGVIRLNRQEAINALSREMIEAISATLAGWRGDDTVRLVLFEAAGSRGFCAGGDVRAVRQLVLEGQFGAVDGYFAAEYAMNEMIATYPKPIAAIGQGVIMGGGIGIFGHCRYRFATLDARFAMPEAAIGFVADVGVNALLAQVPEARALAFLMSGQTVGLGDALVLGLCDAAIARGRVEAVRAGIASAAAAEVETALVQLMQVENAAPEAAALVPMADRLGVELAAGSAGEIVAAIAARARIDLEFAEFADLLATRSPTSLEAIVAGHRTARALGEIGPILELDRRLAGFMVRQPDFAEGVRAVLVDKDRTPRWRPSGFDAVEITGIDAALGRFDDASGEDG